jgi:hypothetical protein
MAKITLTVNNTVMNLKEKTLKTYAGLLTVGDVGADGLQEAVKDAGGEGFAASLLAKGDENDVIELTKEITRKGNKGIVTGKTTRGKLAQRILTALVADTFAVEIVTVVDDKTESDKDDGDFEMEVI